MKPEKATEAPRSAGLDPSTMQMKQWYHGHDRVSEQKAPTGIDRASYHVREHIKDDDAVHATRRGDMPVACLLLCLNELPIRKFEKTEPYRRSRQNSEKMHGAAAKDAYTKSMV